MHDFARAIALALMAGTIATPLAAVGTPASLSPAWPTAIIFDGTPPRAVPVPGSACEIANEYVTLIATDHAAQVPELFAEDGEFVGVEERVLRGRAEIASFYNRVHQGGAVPLSFIDRDDECIMELAGQRPNADPSGPAKYRLVAIDHFTITRDRKIKRLVIFFRPDANKPVR